MDREHLKSLIESLKSINLDEFDSISDDELQKRLDKARACNPEGMVAYEKMLSEIDIDELGQDIGCELRDDVTDMV